MGSHWVYGCRTFLGLGLWRLVVFYVRAFWGLGVQGFGFGG